MSYDIPKNWEELSIGAFSELQKLNPSEYESAFEFKLERLSIILGEDPDELEEKLTIEKLTELTLKTSWISGRPKGEIVEQLGEFYFKGFKNITLGEFIDLQSLCNKGYYLNATSILAILYRRVKVGEWGQLIYEPRSAFTTQERAEEFEEIPVSKAVGVIHEYLKFQENFINRRRALFGLEPEKKDEEIDEEPEEEEDLEDELEEPKTKDEIEEEKQEQALKKWSWEYFIYKIAKGDLTKFDEVTELPLVLVFNMEAMKLELNIQE